MQVPQRVRQWMSSLIAVLFFTGSSMAGEWQAGAAKQVITPTTPMWMAGYGDRNRPADGTLNDLYARAVCLQDETGSRLLVITLDLIGIDRAFAESVCKRLAEQHQLERRQIAICSSHTHTGPVVGGNLYSMHYRTLPSEHQRLIDAYVKTLEQKIVDSATEAISHMAPCQLSWANGRAAFAVNRRNNPEGEVPSRRSAGTLAGPQDHDVPVLAIHATDGSLRAVLFGYACHATVLSSFQWSGDYPGFAAQTLEQDFPGCVALFWAGCGADQNPLPRRQVALAQQYGHELAAAVKQVLEADRRPIGGKLKLNYQEIDLALGPLPARAQWEADAKSENRYVAARAGLMLERMAANETIPTTYPYPIATVKLGDEVEWIFLGGEVVVDYAVRLKSELQGPNTWVCGYANDVMAYIPSRRVLREGGYEGGGAMVYYGLPAPWSDQVEEQIVGTVRQLLK